MKNISRRIVVKAGMVGGIAVLAKASGFADYLPKLLPTPSEIKGPFYPIVAQKDKDFDLTRIDGRSASAKGDAIIIEGTVVDTTGKPISDAMVELWQACASGRYSHPRDPNPAQVDPNFQGWAIVPSGKNGSFNFKTVTPGSYPASRDWIRPPHIHFKVAKRGYIELITQMYFPGHQLNAKDLLFARKGRAEQQQMTAKAVGGDGKNFSYKITLETA